MKSPTQSPAATVPSLSLEGIILLLSDRARWLILQAMADGEPRMINELAAEVGKTPAAVSKHIGVMRQLGIVRITRRAHQLVEAFRPAPGKSEIDFGFCVVRFPLSV